MCLWDYIPVASAVRHFFLSEMRDGSGMAVKKVRMVQFHDGMGPKNFTSVEILRSRLELTSTFRFPAQVKEVYKQTVRAAPMNQTTKMPGNNVSLVANKIVASWAMNKFQLCRDVINGCLACCHVSKNSL